MASPGGEEAMKLPEQMLVKYELGDYLGRGSHAEVYEITERGGSGKCFAVKAVGFSDDRSYRNINKEINALQRLNGHPHIVELVETFESGNIVYLVMERLQKNLLDHMMCHTLSADYVKSFVRQVLLALDYCHRNRVIHRDLKPGNLLINFEDNLLKVADFGSAKLLESEADRTTPYVGSRPYTAPEILLGSKSYTFSVDIWSLGCIFAAMVKICLFEVDGGGKMLEEDVEEEQEDVEEEEDDEEPDEEEYDEEESKIRREEDIKQLKRIFSVLGTPSEEVLPGVTKFIKRKSIPEYARKELKDQFPSHESSGLDLLSRMLCLDPSERISASDALKHPYLKC